MNMDLHLTCLRAYTDDMTSPGSTSPYSAEECRKYLELLRGFQGIVLANPLPQELIPELGGTESGDVSEYRLACTGKCVSPFGRDLAYNSLHSSSPLG